MIFEFKNFSDTLFEGLDYENHIKKNSLDKLLNISLENYGHIKEKISHHPYHGVDTNLSSAIEPELDDLGRLHFLILSRNVTTILEFGVGKSTIIFNDALAKNEQLNVQFLKKNLRRSNPFECHSVDNYAKWIDEVESKNKLENVTLHFSELEMGLFNDRICTFYSSIPNVCPDFIYLDGPDQFSPKGKIRGVSTNHPDRLPMAADILSIEHFLLPGTLIVTDGRTANARFLKANFQRDWIYCHNEAFDQHYFELSETPLGVYNKRQIEFSLGDGFFERLQRNF